MNHLGSVATPRGPTWKPALALLALSLIWGLTWVLAKQGLDHASPFAFAAQRCAGAALALFVAMRLLGRPLRPVAPVATLVIALVNVAAFLSVQTWALVEGGAGRSAVLNYTMPIWMLLLAQPCLGERIRGIQWIGALVAMAGLMLIVEPWNLATGLGSKILGILAGVCWAIGSILIKRLRARSEVDLISLTAWQLLIGTVPLAAIATVVPGQPTDWSLQYIGILAYIAIGSTAIGWWLWVYVLDSAPAWEASLSVLGAPVVAILSSRALLSESFQATEVAGMLMIGVALALLSLANWRASRRGASSAA